MRISFLVDEALIMVNIQYRLAGVYYAKQKASDLVCVGDDEGRGVLVSFIVSHTYVVSGNPTG